MVEAKSPAQKRGSKGGSKVAPGRLQLVECMMAACENKRNIVATVVQEFGVSRQTAYSYCRKVEREWQADTKPTRNYQRYAGVRTIDRAIAGAMEDRKWAAVGNLVMVKSRILGLLEPAETVVQLPDAHPTQSMTSAQIRAYIVEASEKRNRLLALMHATPVRKPSPD